MMLMARIVLAQSRSQELEGHLQNCGDSHKIAYTLITRVKL